MSAAAIKGTVYKQAMVLTYSDVFLFVGIFFALCIPLLLLFTVRGKKVKKVEQEVEMHFAE
jgi:hypothetical protein